MGGGDGAGLRPVMARGGRVVAAGWGLLVPAALWTGFGDPVETPKRLVLAALAAAAWSAALVRPAARARLLAHPMLPPVGALALIAGWSAARSAAPEVAWAGEEGSWTGAAAQIAVWLGALAAASLAPATGRAAAALAAGGLLVAAYAAVQAAGRDPLPWDAASIHRYWLFASLGNPVHVAAWLAAAAGAAGAARGRFPAAGAAVATLFAAGALATRQRTAWIALQAAGAALVAGRIAPGGRRGVRMVLPAAAIVAAAALFITVFPEGRRLLAFDRLGSRPHIWAAAGRIWRDAPWLGAGPDLLHLHFTRHARYAFFVSDPPTVRGADVRLRLPGSAHAEPLQMAATLGLAGAGAWAWAIAAGIRAAGRGGRLLPAAAALFAAHLANPGSAATSAAWWWLLSVGAAAGRRGRTVTGGARGIAPDPPGRRAPGVRRHLVVGAVGAAGALALAVGLRTAWRGALVQAHAREAGRLQFHADAAGLRSHLLRWDAAAADWSPRAAQADAARWRSLAAGPGTAADRDRAARLLDRARAADPAGLFPLCAAADLSLAAGRAGDRTALRIAEAGLREAIARAPAVASLHADLADVLDAAGRAGEARAERARARAGDPAGVFRPRR